MTTRPLHPFLLAPLPFLYMVVANLDQVSSFAGLRLFLITVAIVSVVYGLTWPIVRNAAQAGLIVTGLLVVWYTLPYWGHGVLMIPLAGIGMIARRHLSRIVSVLTFILNAAAIGMMALVLTILASVCIRRDLHLTHASTDPATSPDVYFILLDSYGSHSLLLDRYGYDDSRFLEDLQRLGLHTGECTSPEDDTQASLTNILNGKRGGLTYKLDLIIHNALRSALEARGYSTWAFSTGWQWTEIMDGGRYYQPAYGPMTEFEAFALYLTPLRGLIDLEAERGHMMRLRAATLLDHLPDAAADPQSQFVFAHIVQPHPPFVFNADGTARNPKTLVNGEWTYGDQDQPEYLPDDYQNGYTAQVSYIGTVLPPVLEKIIQAAPESIIILTGDHGPWYTGSPTQSRSVICATRGLISRDAVDAVNELIQ